MTEPRTTAPDRPEPHAAETALRLPLLLIRLAAAAFFLVWSLEKILLPEKQQGVFEAFYGGAQPVGVIVALGVVQTLIVLAFAGGALKTLTYGALLVMHAVSTLSTTGRLIDPYEGLNHLFWAAVPTLAALLALFLLRRYDTLLSLGGRR